MVVDVIDDDEQPDINADQQQRQQRAKDHLQDQVMLSGNSFGDDGCDKERREGKHGRHGERPNRMQTPRAGGEHDYTLALRRLGTEGNLSPSRATRKLSGCPPFSRIAFSTPCREPFSISAITQPPPPAPQTLAARAPCRLATATSLSISGVLMPGALVRRSFHSSRIRRSTSFHRWPASARCMACAMREISAKLRMTCLFPFMYCLKTSQLLMPDCRGAPV